MHHFLFIFINVLQEVFAKPYPEASVPCVLHPIESINVCGGDDERWISISTRSLPPEAIASFVGAEKGSRSNRLLVGSENYATAAIARPDQLLEKSSVSFYLFQRETKTGNAIDQT
ncbi:unnamed protein product, partial [Pocillopora meandrina]